MERKMNGLIILSVLFLFLLLASGCEKMSKNPIPPAGTKVSASSEVFKQAASGLAGECDRLGGCTCFLDGIHTTCALVFACLDAGFCERVATQ